MSWQSTVTNLLSLKVNNHLFSGPYSKKKRPQPNPIDDKVCLLPAYYQQGKTSSLDSNSSTPLTHLWCEYITVLNLCPVVWIKHDLASSLFTISDAKVSSLVQLNYDSIPMQGPWKDKISHSWNLEQKYWAEILKWQRIMWSDTGREICCRDVCLLNGIIYVLQIKNLRNF